MFPQKMSTETETLNQFNKKYSINDRSNKNVG